MTAVLFIRADDLLKASHYKRITVPGHTHGGKWVSPYTKNVLVSDDHDTDKVAAGSGSFYQKQAHKKLAGMVDGFSTMNPDAKASLIVAHATDMQKEASASAAVSGWKKAALLGQNPSKAQWAAFHSQPESKKDQLLNEVESKAGKLSHLSSAKAGFVPPQESTNGIEAQKTEQASPGQPQKAEVDPLSGPTVDTPVPAQAKKTMDGMFADGNVETLQAVADNNSANPHVAAYAQKLLDKLKSRANDGFVTLKGWPSSKFKLNADNQWEAHGLGISDGLVSVQGPELSAALFIKKRMPVPADVVAKLSDKSKAAIVKDAAAEFGMSVMDAQALLTANEKTGPKEGDTKTENGKTYELHNGKWHRVGEFGPLSPGAFGKQAYAAGIKSPMADPDFVAVHGADQSSSQTIQAMSSWHKGWDQAANASTGPGNSAKTVEAAVQADDAASDKAAVAAMETGAFYQKEAVKKLKAEHGAAWADMHPSKQHALAHAKYQALQGAASQAAAVSGWKKHMLSGQVPTPGEVKAFAAMAMEDSAKAGKMLAEVQGKIGGDKLAVLVSQAHAKAVKAHGTAKPTEPAKVFVTTPPQKNPFGIKDADIESAQAPKVTAFGPNNPNVEFKSGAHIVAFDPASGAWKYKNSEGYWEQVVNEPLIHHLNAGRDADGVALSPAAKPVTLADKPAYDHLAQSIANHKGHTLPAQKTFSKLAAQDWMAANPGKGAEMYEALAAHKLSHLAAMIGPDVKPAEKPAPVNTAKAKFKNNDPVNDFIYSFATHGDSSKQGLSIDDLLEPKMIAAYNKLTPLEATDVAAAISFYGPHKLKLFMDWVSAQNAKKAAPVGPVPVTSSVYTNTQPGHNKFWSVSVHGSQMKTTYGKLGTQGSTTTKDFASGFAAQKAAEKLKSEKKNKGYKYGYTGVHQYEGAAPSVYAAPAAVPPPKFDVVSGGWVHQVSDGALSGAPSLSQDTKDGHTYYVAHTGDTFQVGVIDPEGNPMDHEDFAHPEDAAAQMGNYIDGNNAEIPHPSVDDIQALDPNGGPKDGDTKMAMDGGTLVFKNGRWHKQGIVVPSFSDDNSVWGQRYADVAAKLKELFEAGGAKAIKPYIINHASGEISVKGGLVAGVGKLAKLSGGSVKTRHKKMHAFVVAMQAAGKGGKKAVFTTGSNSVPASPKPAQAASSPKVFVAAPPSKPGVTAIDGWAQTGPQTGSNPGGKFKDKNGVEWYCKFPADKNVAMNEILAAKFYEMLGVAVPNLKLVEKGGKTGIASKWVDGMSKATAAKLAKAKGVHEAFAIDAWLANWDVVGLSNDNLMLNKDGAAVHVDVGGSLVYRAQGGEKGDGFGDTVPELETLKDPKKNDKSAAVFAGATPKSMQWGLDQLNKMKPSQITELCEKLGPGSTADKAALAAKLIARREFILKKFGIQDQWTVVHKLDPANLPVNPADLPKPIQFTASSKAHVNAQNTKDSEALIAFASKGNLTALKDYLYDAVDKETSAPLGKKSILDHPSKPLKEQWAGLVELLQSISTPPMPTLTLPSLGSVGELGDISEFVGFFNPQERVETVAAEHRMHFFMALSHIDDISGLVAGMKWSFLKAGGKFVQEAKAKHSSLSAAVRGYISSVQSSGSINHSWSQGKTTVQSGGKSVGIQGLTAKIYAEAQELPEGTTLIRGMSDTSSGKSMCKQLLACAPGTVIQNTDSMCASYNENHSWGGDVQMTIRCAKGCKATLSFASGSFSGEHEITTLPGQRYVVLSTKKIGGTVHLEVLMLPPHEGYVSELSKLSALGKAILVCFKRMM
jgi:predicted DNA-binding WGR domain protein